MARIRKKPDIRREEFLDSAEVLFGNRGYENTSVEALISELGVSKGAFYHHFRSKSDLLDNALDRMLRRIEIKLTELIEAQLPATKKLQNFLISLDADKSAHREGAMPFGNFLLQDANAVLLGRQRRAACNRFAPMLATIIEQGVVEGEFQVATDPACAESQQIAHIVWEMGDAMEEALTRTLIEAAGTRIELKQLVSVYSAYSQAIERVLGAKEHSLRLVDETTFQLWLDTAAISEPF